MKKETNIKVEFITFYKFCVTVGIMEKCLTKSEFMAKVINDKYRRRRAAKEKEYSADIHLIQNSRNIENFKFKREKYKFR